MDKTKMKNRSAVEQLKDRLVNIFAEDTTAKTFDKKNFETEAKRVRDTFNDNDENPLPPRNLI